MSTERIREILKKTLEDHQFTRSEKQAVSAVLDDLKPSPTTLGAYRSEAFKLATEAMKDPRDKEVLSWLENVVKTLLAAGKEGGAASSAKSRTEACFSPGETCPTKIAGLIKSAKQSIDVCVFTITDDRISKPLQDAHRRKVKVRIITDNDKAEDQGSDIELLQRVGIPVVMDQTQYHMHHKFAIFDQSLLLTGSYNWTRSAASSNEENFILTADATLLKAFITQFEKLWKQFK